MEQQDTEIGARVRAARSYANLSQQALGDKLGLERRIVVAIEANDDRHPLSVQEAQRIAKVCGVPFSFVVSGWAAPPELEARVGALEERVRKADADRALLGQQLEELDERLERRFATLGSPAPQQDTTPGRADNPREGEGRQAP